MEKLFEKQIFINFFLCDFFVKNNLKIYIFVYFYFLEMEFLNLVKNFLNEDLVYFEFVC